MSGHEKKRCVFRDHSIGRVLRSTRVLNNMKIPTHNNAGGLLKAAAEEKILLDTPALCAYYHSSPDLSFERGRSSVSGTDFNGDDRRRFSGEISVFGVSFARPSTETRHASYAVGSIWLVTVTERAGQHSRRKRTPERPLNTDVFVNALRTARILWYARLIRRSRRTRSGFPKRNGEIVGFERARKRRPAVHLERARRTL